MDVTYDLITRMVQDNDHNKYTTLYYLLLKKNEKGELSFTELKNWEKKNSNFVENKKENEEKINKKYFKKKNGYDNYDDRDNKGNNKSEDESFSGRYKKVKGAHKKGENSLGRSSHSRNSRKSNSKKSRSRKSHSRHSRKKSSGRGTRENFSSISKDSRASKDSRGSKESELPTIRPQITVNDITVEVKERITFNTSRARQGQVYPYSRKNNTTTHKESKNRNSIRKIKKKQSSKGKVSM